MDWFVCCSNFLVVSLSPTLTPPSRSELQLLGVSSTRCRFPGARSDITCRVNSSLSSRPESYRIIVENTG